jgi:hypothetical protein
MRDGLLSWIERDGLGGTEVPPPGPEDGGTNVRTSRDDLQGFGEFAGHQEEGEGRGRANPCAHLLPCDQAGGAVDLTA